MEPAVEDSEQRQFEHIRYRAGERAITITLDRPPLNVLDLQTIQELDRALEIAADSELHTVVLRGAGERAFSAGVAVEDHSPDRVHEMLECFHRVIRTLWSLDQVTVAVVQADALGGGFELVTACDLILAAEEARFGQPEIDVGCFPPVAAALLPRRIGHHRTCELLYLGERIGADEARSWGLVNWTVPRSGLEERCRELLGALDRKSAAVLRVSRRAILAAEEAGWRKALERTESIYLRQLTRTEDMEEGVSAFLEDRDPRWRDR